MPKSETVDNLFARSADACRRSRALCQKTEELRARHGELRSQFKYWNTHYLRVICVWCKQHIKYERLAEPQEETLSHGMCRSCFERRWPHLKDHTP